MSDSIDGLKQRLVGAFVILTLAIIFLPMIFDKPHIVGNSKIVSVPPKTDFQTVVINKPKKPSFEVLDVDPSDNKVKIASRIKTAKPVPVSALVTKQATKSSSSKLASKPKTIVKKTATPNVSHLPIFKNVWMVQLGTFGDSANAYRLRDKIRRDGFDGHTKKVNIKGKASVRVLSGPFVNKREAHKVKKKLDAKYKVNSLIVYFEA